MPAESIFEQIRKETPEQKPVYKAQDMQKPPSSPAMEDMNTLLSRWQKSETPGDTAELLKRMEPTINSALSSYAGGFEKQLKIQAANITLSALRSYKKDKNVSPSTYVFSNLKRLNRLRSNRSNIIHIPEDQQYLAQKISDKIKMFEDKEDREPSMAELADITGLNPRKLEKIMGGSSVVSESSTLSEDSGDSTQSSSNLTDKDYLDYLYYSSSPVDQKILEWTTGLYGRKPISTAEIAAKLKISAPAVSQRRARLQKTLSEIRGLL